jgi:geranylgeranyl pyrophosphate synthase
LKQEYSVESDNEATFKSYVARVKSIVESELAKLVSELSNLNLHSQIEYAVLSKGKRLRPLLVILSAESVGGNRNKVMPLALAFELMHTATLVHDDIIDGDELRRGIPALHKKWSVNDAILTGDALIALAVNLASQYREEILKAVSQSALELCEGEQMDVSLLLETATEEEYFRKIREKSASLFRAATYSGALTGGGTPHEIDCLSMFGENFGIAYQLRDDLLDLTNKENLSSVSKDLRSGRVTLPLIHSYMTNDSWKRKQLRTSVEAVMKEVQVINSAKVENIVSILKQTGAFNYCEKKIDEHLQKAVACIAPLKSSVYKAHLIQMVKWLKVMA